MAFNISHADADTGKDFLIPAGKYEVVIKDAFINCTKSSNKPYISIVLVLRNDISQPYKNSIIWHALWKRKEPTNQDLMCEGYSSGQINAISKATAIPDGTNYKGVEDWADGLINRCVTIEVKHETYQENKRAVISQFYATNHPSCTHDFQLKGEREEAPVGLKEVDLCDLPF